MLNLNLILNKWWQTKYSPAVFFIPLSWLYWLIISTKKFAFTIGILKSYKINVPIIVVGNITVGGTGKTPVVIALVKELKQKGIRVGIVSRGYKSKNNTTPYDVKLSDLAEKVGDEPCLIKHKLQDTPIVIAKSKVQACKFLLKNHDLDLIVSDDGLQHSKLQRDYEIALVSPETGLSNARLLPAGPLREPKNRLQTVDKILFPQKKPLKLISVADNSKTLPLSAFVNKAVCAASGIQLPTRFFKMLKKLNYQIIETFEVADHAALPIDKLQKTNLPVIITQKDAVKLTGLKLESFWFLDISVNIPCDIIQEIEEII